MVQGLGVHFYEDEGRYEGNWKNNLRHGQVPLARLLDRAAPHSCAGWLARAQGTMYFANKDTYDGEWFEGKQCGYGTLRKGRC
jgi:hypothetical protein